VSCTDRLQFNEACVQESMNKNYLTLLTQIKCPQCSESDEN
jgi:hypothetical protein